MQDYSSFAGSDWSKFTGVSSDWSKVAVASSGAGISSGAGSSFTWTGTFSMSTNAL